MRSELTLCGICLWTGSLEQAYKLLAKEDAATREARRAVEETEHAYDGYVYEP